MCDAILFSPLPVHCELAFGTVLGSINYLETELTGGRASGQFRDGLATRVVIKRR